MLKAINVPTSGSGPHGPLFLCVG